MAFVNVKMQAWKCLDIARNYPSSYAIVTPASERAEAFEIMEYLHCYENVGMVKNKLERKVNEIYD